MGTEEHVKRPGYALASVVALMFFLMVILGVALSHMDYSSGVTEALVGRVRARNALLSMTNLALRWLAEDIRSGLRLGKGGGMEADSPGELTESDSFRIFALKYDTGYEVKVYDLNHGVRGFNDLLGVSSFLPPVFPGGYMIRATAERDGMAPLVFESVYLVTLCTVSEEDAVWVLDRKPVYSREIFRY